MDQYTAGVLGSTYTWTGFNSGHQLLLGLLHRRNLCKKNAKTRVQRHQLKLEEHGSIAYST